MFVIVLLMFISIVGICSFNINNSYDIVNQYGDTVKMWGSGIYKHDSYFKAVILIGTDFAVLFVIVPMLIVGLVGEIKYRTVKTKLFLVSTMGCVLYYSASIDFGATYNLLHLPYIALFSSSFFAFIILIVSIDKEELMNKQTWNLPSKGIKIFLVLSGISLFVAWLPDIVPTLFSGESLSLIEVYTTEITYVLDMGIVSPIMFICLYQLKNGNPFGHILLAVILKACEFVGVMLVVQSIFQILANVDIPVAAIITKAAIFVLLSLFSVHFNVEFYKNLKV